MRSSHWRSRRPTSCRFQFRARCCKVLHTRQQTARRTKRSVRDALGKSYAPLTTAIPWEAARTRLPVSTPDPKYTIAGPLHLMVNTNHRTSERISTEKTTASRHPTNESQLAHLMKTATFFMDISKYLWVATLKTLLHSVVEASVRCGAVRRSAPVPLPRPLRRCHVTHCDRCGTACTPTSRACRSDPRCGTRKNDTSLRISGDDIT